MSLLDMADQTRPQDPQQGFAQDPDHTAPLSGGAVPPATPPPSPPPSPPTSPPAAAPGVPADAPERTVPAYDEAAPSPTRPRRRPWRERVRGARNRTVLGGIAAALALLLVGCAGGYAVGTVGRDGHRGGLDDGYGRDGGLGPGGFGPGDDGGPKHHDRDDDGDDDGPDDRTGDTT